MNLKIINKCILVVLVLFTITNLSCRKVTQSRIKGKWTVVDLSSASNRKEEWTFYNGGQVSISISNKENDTPFFSVTNNGNYKIKAAKKMVLSGFLHESMHLYNTTWEIADISKKRLLLVNDQDKSTGLFFVEFLRVIE